MMWRLGELTHPNLPVDYLTCREKLRHAHLGAYAVVNDLIA